ncbi:MAG: hypothetical protein ACTSRW_17240, partial [Candidatus Helarchaeota archaeon]
HPHLLFAEILVNQSTSQEMIEKMGMAFLGYYMNKTLRKETRLDLIPCALLFKRNPKIVQVDARIAPVLKYILEINKLDKIWSIHSEICKNTPKDSTFDIIETCIPDKPHHYMNEVKIDEENRLSYAHNTYLDNIYEATLTVNDPDAANFLISHLKSLDSSYTEIMVPPDLMLQDLLIQNRFRFTAFLPNYWGGNDMFVFSIYKNSPKLLPKTRKIYQKLIEVDYLE